VDNAVTAFYLYLGYTFASILWTAFALGVVVLIAYVFARIEIRQERKARRIKENRNA